MPQEKEQREIKPLEKREIRGLTLESFLRYGAMIVGLLYTAFTLNSKVEVISAQNVLLKFEKEKLEIRVKILEEKQSNCDVRNARIEEQLKNKK